MTGYRLKKGFAAVGLGPSSSLRPVRPCSPGSLGSPHRSPHCPMQSRAERTGKKEN